MMKIPCKAVRLGCLPVLWILCFGGCESDAPNTAPSLPVPGTLQAVATADTNRGTAVLAVAFHAEASGGTSPYRYAWDFNARDGIQTDGSNQDASFSFAIPETYTVTLTVLDAAGAVAKDTLHVLVGGRIYFGSPPVMMVEVHGTPEDPRIIEGKDISALNGNGIFLNRCSYVVIRNNFVHGVTDPSGLGSHNLGNAVLVQNSQHIEILGNRFEDNQKGVYVFSPYEDPPCSDILIRDNALTGSDMMHGIQLRWVEDAVVSGNVLIDNGDPALFETGRLSGIYLWDFRRAVIRDNFALRSSGDGIAAGTSREMIELDPSFVCEDLEVSNNAARENGEQGFWFGGIRQCLFAGNYAEANDNPDPGLGSSGLVLNWNCSEFEVHDNRFRGNEISGVTIAMGHDNAVHNNVFEETRAAVAAVWVNEMQFSDSYFPVPSENNEIRNNLFVHNPRAVCIEKSSGTGIFNNTFFRNGPFHTGTSGIEIGAGAEGVVVRNNIVAEGQGFGMSAEGTGATLGYNDFWRNTPADAPKDLALGPGHISADPRFKDPEHLDFRLAADSPCVNAGDPEARSNDTDGTRNDMGAFGGPGGRWLLKPGGSRGIVFF